MAGYKKRPGLWSIILEEIIGRNGSVPSDRSRNGNFSNGLSLHFSKCIENVFGGRRQWNFEYKNTLKGSNDPVL